MEFNVADLNNLDNLEPYFYRRPTTKLADDKKKQSTFLTVCRYD